MHCLQKLGLLALAAVVFTPEARTQAKESVEQIMSRVAANQDRSQQMRAAFVYHQDLLLRFKRSNGRTAREELREYTVTPDAKSTKKTLTRFTGKYEKDGKLNEYTEPGYTYKDLDLDGEIIDSLADDLANENGSRDGIACDLFPLTSREQKKYVFTLHGMEEHRGKDTYRITFKPSKSNWDDDDGTHWAGEILVDTHDYQPVFTSTRLAKGLPVVVKTLLGTNLKGLGFKLTYDKFDEGLWFPVTYGGEFELKAVFFYKRKISVALNNSGFKHAVVDTRISFEEPLQIDPSMKAKEVKLPSPPPF